MITWNYCRRSLEREWMDSGNYSASQYVDCLEKLDRVGRFLGGDKATFRAFDSLDRAPCSILDVGCGGGLFTIKLAQRYPSARVVGVDIAPEAIAFAQERLRVASPRLNNLEFIHIPTPDLPFLPGSFDVVTSTLVCHHLSDSSLISFLKTADQIASQAVIFNDLHRHPLATVGFALVAPFAFPNRMVWHDGLVSIRRGFVREDWRLYRDQAGIAKERFSLAWHWAFRWMVVITK